MKQTFINILNFIKDPFIILFSIVIFFICSFFPINNPSGEGYYEFNMDYIDGINRTKIYKLPNNFSYYVATSKGSYFVKIYSTGKNIFGFEALCRVDEMSISGVININSIKRIK